MGNYHGLSDSELISKLNLFEAKAFDEVYRRYWDKLFDEASAVTRDAGLAGDLVQDVFESLLKRRGKLNPGTSLSQFLFSCIRNRALNLIRHERVEENYFQSLLEYADEIEADVEKLYQDKQLREQIAEQVENMPPEMREVLQLRIDGNLSMREIARLLILTDTFVKKQINLAYKMLRVKLISHILLLSLLIITASTHPQRSPSLMIWLVLHNAIP